MQGRLLATASGVVRSRLGAERFPTPAYEMASAFSTSHEAQIQRGG